MPFVVLCISQALLNNRNRLGAYHRAWQEMLCIGSPKKEKEGQQSLHLDVF